MKDIELRKYLGVSCENGSLFNDRIGDKIAKISQLDKAYIDICEKITILNARLSKLEKKLNNK